jgi:hypothetical protein
MRPSKRIRRWVQRAIAAFVLIALVLLTLGVPDKIRPERAHHTVAPLGDTIRATHSRPPGSGPFGDRLLSASHSGDTSAPGLPTPLPAAAPANHPRTFPAQQYTRSPSTAATASALTGVTDLSRLAIRDACARPTPETATCLAQVITSNSTGQPLTLPSTSPSPPEPASTSPALTLTPSIPTPATEPGGVAAPPVGSPGYLQQAYDLMGLSGTAGSGDTLAIVDAYGYATAESDLATYRSHFGLPPCTSANGCFHQTDQNGGTNYPPGNSEWEIEQALDLDAASALCPNCHLLLVQASSNQYSDLIAAEHQAAILGANQISNSWAGSGPVSEAPASSAFSFPGVSVIAASGDSGYDGGNTHTSWPAALPLVTAAGGTSLTASSSPGERGFQEKSWAGTGSGCAAETKPAWQADSGCTGRSYNDVAAVADPHTGLSVYDSQYHGYIAVGGTSLATPLIAAYYALVGGGAGVGSASWDYTNSPLLTDVTSGSNGSCSGYPPAASYICASRAGYDGPTGNGAITGAAVTGAPGIGGPGATGTYVTATTSTAATVVAGVYPNQNDTTYWWEYGPTTSYGNSTPPLDAGSSTNPVSTTTTFTALTSAAYYHYRLVAANSAGTTYGYDYVLTTSASPLNVSLPTIVGTTAEGHALTASPGTWAATGSITYTYQWSRCAPDGTGCASIAEATGTTHVLTGSDVGAALKVLVTASNGVLHSSASSTATTVIAGVAPAVSTSWSQVSVPKTPPFELGENLYGISCPTTTLCVAGGGSGQIFTSTNPTGGANSWANSVIDGSTPILAVSCPSPSLCVATDYTGHILSSTNPTGGAAAWSVAHVDGTHSIGAVSCPGITLCVAADSAGNILRSSDPTGGAGAWTIVYVGNSFRSVSCPTASLCVAGNAHGDIVTSTNPTGGAGAWTTVNVSSNSILGLSCATVSLCVGTSTGGSVITSTNPTGGTGAWTVTAVDASNVLYAVSCVSSAECVATDSAGNVITSVSPSGGAGAWTVTHVDGTHTFAGIACPTSALCVATDDGGNLVTTATPMGAASGWTVSAVLGHDPLYAISCGTPSLCVAVDWAGNVLTSTDPTGGAESWVKTHLVSTYLDSISCYLRSLCVAGSGVGSLAVSTAPTAGAGAWHIVNVGGGNSVASIACPSTSLCVAGDSAGNLLTSSNPTGGASAWAVAHVDGSNYILGISCPAVTLCIAVDSAGNVLSSTNPAGGAGAWTVARVDANAIASVSCPSQTLCIASDYFGGIASSTNPAGGGGSWTVRSIDSGKTLYSVSCPSTASCTAVDNGGNILSSTHPSGEADAWTTANLYSSDNGLYSVSCPSTLFCAASGDTPAIMVESTARPTISGSSTDGQTLTAHNGTWTGSTPVSYLYQWQRCDNTGAGCTPIDLATSSAYTLTAADAGHKLRSLVTATNSAGSANGTSTATAVVADIAPASTAAPTLTGTPTDGQTLTTSNGTFTGGNLSYAYQWQRCDNTGAGCTPIDLATSSAYTLTAADAGHKLRSLVTATNSAGSANGTSTATAVIADIAPASMAAPTLSGTPTDGQTLTPKASDGGALTVAANSSFTGDNLSYAYQWQRCSNSDVSCSGGAWNDTATTATYPLASTDVGHVVRVQVTATNSAGVVDGMSTATAVVADMSAPVNSALPTVSGTTTVGQTLNATTGAWTGTPTITYTRQWRRCDSAGSNCTGIEVATEGAYTLLPADVGSTLRVAVTATNTAGERTVASAPTATVAAAAPDGPVVPPGRPLAPVFPPATAAPPPLSPTPAATLLRLVLRNSAQRRMGALVLRVTGVRIAVAPMHMHAPTGLYRLTLCARSGHRTQCLHSRGRARNGWLRLPAVTGQFLHGARLGGARIERRQGAHWRPWATTGAPALAASSSLAAYRPALVQRAEIATTRATSALAMTVPSLIHAGQHALVKVFLRPATRSNTERRAAFLHHGASP